MNFSSSLRVAAAAMLLLATQVVLAADDHGHDHGGAPASASGPAAPRFAAVSEAFELVGVLSGRQLTLFLDHFGDNSPVKGAQLELQVDGTGVRVTPHGEGQFEALLAEVPKAGVLSIVATVTAGSASDLLAGELDVHDAAPVPAAASRPGWRRWAAWGLGAVVLLGVAAAWAGRRGKGAARPSRIGGAA